MIAKVSNQELDASLKRLVVSERKLLHLILDHINEVDARKLYLEMAYSSLYDYLVNECKYSGSAAMRRISAARLMREVPNMAVQIQSGHLNLSQVSELSRAINEKEKSGSVVSLNKKAEIMKAISGKSTLESQREIAKGLDLNLKVPEKTFMQKDDSVHLQITLTQEQYQQLLQCRDSAASILLTENQDVSMASVIGLLAEQFLVGRSVKLKNKNQKNEICPLTEKIQSANKEVCPEVIMDTGADAKVIDKPVTRLNKTLTPKTKSHVLSRDKCCQFKDLKTGKICGSTFNLEIDHRQPRWANGSHEINNLQVLCRSHNNYKYQKEINLC